MREPPLPRLTERPAWSFHQDGTAPDASGCIFVFGSNLAGRHGKGAARIAISHYGARYGLGRGRWNRSYAVPTKDEHLRVMSLNEIRQEVDVFIDYARGVPQELFFVTRVGCGLAGYDDAEIAPMFTGAPGNCSFAAPWRRYLCADVPWE